MYQLAMKQCYSEIKEKSAFDLSRPFPSFYKSSFVTLLLHHNFNSLLIGPIGGKLIKSYEAFVLGLGPKAMQVPFMKVTRLNELKSLSVFLSFHLSVMDFVLDPSPRCLSQCLCLFFL